MLSDLNTPSPNKSLFVISIVSIVMLIILTMLYLSTRQASFAKTQAYSVEVKLNAEDSQQLVAAYNYGYGFNPSHQQVFKLLANQSQTINFSVSAWKELKSLRLTSDQTMLLDSLTISKSGAVYQALQSPAVVAQDSPLELSEISQKLLEIKD